MNENELREFFAWAEKRNQIFYAWLRHLLILASGALTVLVSLHADKQSTGIPLLFMRIGWITLGCGILFGSLRLYGEVWTEREKVKSLVKQRTSQKDISPIVVNLPAFIKWNEKLCYCSLILAVVSLVIFALTRSS